MDLHPIIVHFPIALLTLYALFEIARFPLLTRHQAYFYVKAVLLLVGVMALPIALATGDEAADVFEGTQLHDVVEAHEHFAQYATAVFVILAIGYLLLLLEREWAAFGNSQLGKKILPVATLVERWWIAIPLAGLGFILLLITGALGGVLVYGPEADPIAPYILALLGLSA